VACLVQTEALFLKNLDNRGEIVVVTESLHLNKNAYGIRLNFQIEEKLANTPIKQIRVVPEGTFCCIVAS